jgi:hypothetical protein
VRPSTNGMRSKFCGGGGEGGANSKVDAPQGFEGAGAPLRQLVATFHRKIRKLAKNSSAPSVES